MREIYSISCMKEGNVQIILRCKMVCCTPFPGQSLEELQTEKNFIFGPSLKITVDTLIYDREEISKPHF